MLDGSPADDATVSRLRMEGDATASRTTGSSAAESGISSFRKRAGRALRDSNGSRGDEKRLACASWRNSENLPPWLASLVLHLLVLLALAVLSYSGAPRSALELVLARDSTGFDQPLELDETFEIETLSSREVESMAVQRPLEVESLTSLEPTLEDFLVEEPNPTAFSLVENMDLLANFGDEAAGGGNLGQTSMFGLSAEGSKFVYVFDRSKSMNSVYAFYHGETVISQVTPLALAKEELIRSLNRLTDDCQFQIIFYNAYPLLFSDDAYSLGTVYDSQGLFRTTEEHKSQAKQFVAKVLGNGNTNHWAALQAAVQLEPDAVFLITDGEAKDDPPWSELRNLARHCRRRQIKINIIHFSDSERPRCSLVKLAKGTGGVHRFFDLRETATSHQ